MSEIQKSALNAHPQPSHFEQALKTRKPNILWVCTDQQRYDTIGALGNPHVNTPNLDRLVSEGVAFSHAFCQTPICTGSRSCMLTGMYPSRVHGCQNGNDYWDEAAPLVTKLLADSNYDCGLVGKLHLAGAHGRIEPRPKDDGYRLFEWSHHGRDDWPSGHAYAEWVRSQGFDLDELLNDRVNVLTTEVHQTTWCANVAKDFITEKRSGPWLMSVNIFDPHPDRGMRFTAPQDFLDKYDPDCLPGPLYQPSDLASQARLDGVDFQTSARDPESFASKRMKGAYYAMIELIDWNIGRLLDQLVETGQYENTIVIFMSDHGEMLGDHGLVGKGCRFYEGLVRVPLIISWPGHFYGGLVSDALVELTDIAPTLLDAVGLPVSEAMQGQSLLSILVGEKDPHYHRDFVRSEYYRALNPAKRPWFEGSYATMVRDQRYKLVTYHGHETGELFDLDRDPAEFCNLWDKSDYRDVRFKLMKRSFDALAFALDVGPKQTRLH